MMGARLVRALISQNGYMAMLEGYYKFENLILKVLLGACVVLVVVASLARWVGYPIIWSVDIAQLLFIWICFLGANQALRHDQHIGVDFLIRRCPKKLQYLVEAVGYALTIAFLLALIRYGYDLTTMNVERRLSDTDMSYAWVTAAVPVGCALLALTSVGKFFVALQKLLGKAEG
ncbi:hypothetical protein A3843_14110 [Pseudovibrio exalbescens]|uniref:TRAP transporter small permease protein n=2 Tax=Pseudovibrio exalbescens TaxID=197461 RepID=A0A1U7JF75_9HYPH|nr:TRAP transporter small permease [Pseudovibrio exalbescens]OKL43355.1 hypothetical protein A3843_14110 [Pseudovibrio exalbescens]